MVKDRLRFNFQPTYSNQHLFLVSLARLLWKDKTVIEQLGTYIIQVRILDANRNVNNIWNFVSEGIIANWRPPLHLWFVLNCNDLHSQAKNCSNHNKAINPIPHICCYSWSLDFTKLSVQELELCKDCNVEPWSKLSLRMRMLGCSQNQNVLGSLAGGLLPNDDSWMLSGKMHLLNFQDFGPNSYKTPCWVCPDSAWDTN